MNAGGLVSTDWVGISFVPGPVLDLSPAVAIPVGALLLATALDDIGHDATHVNDHGLVTASDKQIAKFAAASGMTVASADSDFAMHLAMTGIVPLH